METIKEAFENITDCFTGTDGAVKFAIVKFALEDLAGQAENGDESDIVLQFSKLIDILGDKK